MKAGGARQSTKGGGLSLDLGNVIWLGNCGHFGTSTRIGLLGQAGSSESGRLTPEGGEIKNGFNGG